MIPYDDLVAALSAWRARQGLPVNAIGGGGSGPTATPGSGPTARPGSGPNRAAPPAPPSSSRPNMQVAAVEEEVAAEELEEAAYDNEGNDFAMAFGGTAPAEEGDDATSIGQAPERPTEMDMDHGADKDDW